LLGQTGDFPEAASKGYSASGICRFSQRLCWSLGACIYFACTHARTLLCSSSVALWYALYRCCSTAPHARSACATQASCARGTLSDGHHAARLEVAAQLMHCTRYLGAADSCAIMACSASLKGVALCTAPLLHCGFCIAAASHECAVLREQHCVTSPVRLEYIDCPTYCLSKVQNTQLHIPAWIARVIGKKILSGVSRICCDFFVLSSHHAYSIKRFADAFAVTACPCPV
jgi:hypothetical protein